MKQIFVALLLTVAVAGCNQSPTSQSETTGPATATQPAANSAAGAKPSRRLSPERLKQIAASGKTGMWTQPAVVCAKANRKRVAVTVEWNVPQPADARVMLLRVGKDGKEHQVAHGAAVGGRVTSTSSASADVFVLRDGVGKELARMTVQAKPC
jgi:hypothetical protein